MPADTRPVLPARERPTAPHARRRAGAAVPPAVLIVLATIVVILPDPPRRDGPSHHPGSHTPGLRGPQRQA